jgi:peptidoglycan hydrolase-like protein with peptidoglycan-binding domain/GH25 family lysozyme M1 (1,4-beta-N-acetylmuramidase)
MQPLNMYNAKGVDVSNYQRNINWVAVKAAGYSFAFIKSSEGITFVDREFNKSYTNAKANGFIVGPYHFARVYNDPVQEADFFIKTVKSFNGFQNGDLPPVLDIEVAGGLNRAQMVKWCRTWINRVKARTGLQPILYTYLYFAKSYLDSSLSDVPLWFARYGVNRPEDVSGWSKWTFLQFSDTGVVPGINASAVDLNLFHGGLEVLRNFISGGKSSNPTLKQGDTGKAVETLQAYLNKFGFYNGPVDGNFGSLTVTAVMSFQIATEIKNDGIIGPLSWEMIDYVNNHPILKKGDQGNDVKLLQTKLKYINYYSGAINGIFDDILEQAVRLFQKKNQLNVDGILHPSTWVKILHTTTHYQLMKGSTGDQVQEIQTFLKRLGFYSGAIDGIFGDQTEVEVKAFQSQNGLTVDGIVGPITNDALYHNIPPTIKFGDSGAEVLRLQNLLQQLSYYSGSLDGIWGAGTNQAVKLFQKLNNLTVDGIVGSNTWNALMSTPVKYSATTPISSLLKIGDSGEDVRNLQNNLTKLGFSVGAIDGVFGPQTKAAVKSFQSAKRSTIDGIAGPQTLGAIRTAMKNLSQISKPTLKSGNSGSKVKALQQYLAKLGYSPGAIDGIFGSKTKQSVMAFQKTNSLTVDGIVGQETWLAILSRI